MAWPPPLASLRGVLFELCEQRSHGRGRHSCWFGRTTKTQAISTREERKSRLVAFVENYVSIHHSMDPAEGCDASA